LALFKIRDEGLETVEIEEGEGSDGEVNRGFSYRPTSQMVAFSNIVSRDQNNLNI
jgi:hypothetical protein